ncbi:autotransporter outer membrane beta-barrel domain-containing protein [Bartonella taylorii]|uniref:Autotransporter outer membrane beta-barrel domain-containing protein n=1 Tax=Bartonella taylorii TaxID=33046 RepID=A0A9Q9DME5_BARTA|nr:autotransporter outer membrane beta-barrel domain-containing protein [Bartonella taylorii]USP03072.1 autotransporter outer membrane beta-barrel domain-containing protein [Bartonella taylorii]
MYKKYPLSCTIATIMMLSSVPFSAYAAELLANAGEDITGTTGATYEKIKATSTGIIHGKSLKVIGPLTHWQTPSIGANGEQIIDENGNPVMIDHTAVRGTGVEAIGPSSQIYLEDTNIQRVTIGLDIKDNSKIRITNGTIDAGQNSDREIAGIKVDNQSTVELNNVSIEVTNGLGGQIKDGSILNMTGGSVKSFKSGISFADSMGEDNELKDVKINAKENGIMTDASAVTLKNVNVENVQKGLYADNGSQITVSAGLFQGKNLGIYAGNGSNIILKDGVTVLSTQNGIQAEKQKSKITMTGGTLSTTGSQSAAYAKSSGQIDLIDVVVNAEGNGLLVDDQEAKITMTGGTLTTTGSKLAVHAKSNGQINLKDVVVNASSDGLLADDQEAKITMVGGTLTTTGSKLAVHAKSNGQINLKDVVVNASSDGLLADDQEAKITMVRGTLTTTGSKPAVHAKSNGQINLTDVVVNASSDGLKMQGDQSKIILKNSKVFADLLLITAVDTKSPGISYVTADNSTLEGGARILVNESDKVDQTSLSLINGTKWLLKISTQEKDNAGNLLDISKRSLSEVSVLNLNNSSITFDSPMEDHYQTLHIGSGKPDTTAVYNATENAKIYLNTEWSDGIAIGNQKTDRLLIHGDVSGTTTVYFQNRLEKEAVTADDSDPLNTRGISLIQVSGEANENSFKLENSYIAIKGLPYKYILTAYGPKANYGLANANQNLLGSSDNFWDFRLQNAFLDPDSKVKAVLPQVANYFVMPNALFYIGLTDMVKQNALLSSMRTSALGKNKEKKTGFFLYTYGSTGTLSSESSPRKYGYSGADIRYAALQGSIALPALKGKNITTHLGLVGTYGQISFTPKDMQDAGKSTLDKWSLTAYGSIQHDNGFYIDTLLSYGIIKGDITNAIIGKTAEFKNAKMLSISTIVGKQFATGMEALTFEPQIQLAYQHLTFDTLSDADGFKVDMNNPHQYLIRVGGRLTKTVVTTQKGRFISFYGKVNAIKTFGDDKAIHIDKNYQLDTMGTAIEGGLGINAQLSQNISLYGDVNYQQKLQKTGISGANFSGGIRYQF